MRRVMFAAACAAVLGAFAPTPSRACDRIGQGRVLRAVGRVVTAPVRIVRGVVARDTGRCQSPVFDLGPGPPAELQPAPAPDLGPVPASVTGFAPTGSVTLPRRAVFFPRLGGIVDGCPGGVCPLR